MVEVQKALELYVQRNSGADNYATVLATLLAPLITSPRFDEASFTQAIAAEIAKRKRTMDNEGA